MDQFNFSDFPNTNFNETNLDFLLEETAKNTADIEELKAGGTVIDYEDLQNLPEINGITLIGDKSLEDIGAASADDVADLKSDIGDLSDLDTEDKSSLVNAINEARGTGGSGLTEAMKQALLQLARKVVYIDSGGQTYYNALYAAFYGSIPVVVLDSISAVFNQGSAVIYDTDSLDTLKQYLVVTATYSDSTSAVVTDYTLSGTLTAGTSVVTVSYNGKTTTFNVTVTHNPYWVVLSIADDFVAGAGTGGSWNDTLGGYFVANANRCACSVFLNHVMEHGYKYTFECNISNNKNFGVPYYKAAALTAVQNHQGIGGSAGYFIADPGWKTHGYVFTPPEDCIAQIQFNATQAALLSAGITELRIIKEVV